MSYLQLSTNWLETKHQYSGICSLNSITYYSKRNKQQTKVSQYLPRAFSLQICQHVSFMSVFVFICKKSMLGLFVQWHRLQFVLECSASFVLF